MTIARQPHEALFARTALIQRHSPALHSFVRSLAEDAVGRALELARKTLPPDLFRGGARVCGAEPLAELFDPLGYKVGEACALEGSTFLLCDSGLNVRGLMSVSPCQQVGVVLAQGAAEVKAIAFIQALHHHITFLNQALSPVGDVSLDWPEGLASWRAFREDVIAYRSGLYGARQRFWHGSRQLGEIRYRRPPSAREVMCLGWLSISQDAEGPQVI